MECQKCGHELSGPDDTHLCQPTAHDIIEAALATDHPSEGDWYFCQERFRVTFNPVHVSAMENVCEAKQRDRERFCPYTASTKQRAWCRENETHEHCEHSCAALDRLNELRGTS